MHVVISPPDRRACFGRLPRVGTCDVKAQQCEKKKTEYRSPDAVFPIAEVFAHDIGIMPCRDCVSEPSRLPLHGTCPGLSSQNSTKIQTTLRNP